MDAPTRDPTDDAVGLLQGARPTVPDSLTEAALARLRSALFGAAPRYPVLARYPIVRRLGEGGAGIVYLAHDVELDRPVAVKFIRAAGERASEGGNTSRERLRHEAEAIARAPHPNILAIYDVGTATDETGEPCTFLVLEYVEGADLRTWLAGDHGWRRTLDVFMAAGQGLAAAHAAGVTHRDFKPANVMVGNDGRVRVLDFGLARTGATRDHRRVTLDDAVTDLQLTEDGTVIGTPAYMAPEQHAGGLATAASDQFGFCVALWEGLLGARPFAGQSLERLAQAKRDSAPTLPPPKPGTREHRSRTATRPRTIAVAAIREHERSARGARIRSGRAWAYRCVDDGARGGRDRCRSVGRSRSSMRGRRRPNRRLGWWSPSR